MKNIIKKSITTVIIMALALTLAMPVTAQAAKKKAPKISKTKVTMTITKKKTKPAVQLKVKNVSAKNVKWTTSNKKVATVSKNGKVVAKKKGNAVITVKVKGSKTLRCKVTVKDNRKPVTKKPAPAPSAKPPVGCQHEWVEKEKVVGEKLTCNHGLVFYNDEDYMAHCDPLMEQGLPSCSVGISEITEIYYECSKCGKTK
ncbi:MAG: hypothetical protein HFE75_03660 [Firmicutes bacterium]|jgi:hypothetical protein|nr:hypothetical protein [Bacillota bacterium]